MAKGDVGAGSNPRDAGAALGYRLPVEPPRWRTVHWLAYTCWPLAVVHGFESGTDSSTRRGASGLCHLDRGRRRRRRWRRWRLTRPAAEPIPVSAGPARARGAIRPTHRSAGGGIVRSAVAPPPAPPAGFHGSWPTRPPVRSTPTREPSQSTGRSLVDTVIAAGLRGRGGAAFPTGVKMAAVAAGSGPRRSWPTGPRASSVAQGPGPAGQPRCRARRHGDGRSGRRAGDSLHQAGSAPLVASSAWCPRAAARWPRWRQSPAGTRPTARGSAGPPVGRHRGAMRGLLAGAPGAEAAAGRRWSGAGAPGPTRRRRHVRQTRPRPLRGRSPPTATADADDRTAGTCPTPRGLAVKESRLVVDRIACDGHGNCHALFPTRLPRRLGAIQ